MKVKPKIEGGVIKEPHGPHDLGVIKRTNTKKREKIEIEKAAQKVAEYPKVKVANKFKELRTLLSNLKYEVDKECFELLCFLHNYISHNRDDTDSKNELADILHDILIEIFLPIKPSEPYKKYTGEDEGNRVHFYTTDKEKEINHIYDLNIFSEVWLKDISAYYDLSSEKFSQYNFRSLTAKKAKRKKEEGYTSKIRIMISRHLLAHIVKKLKHDIQLIKDNDEISKEDKIESISDEITEALFDAPIKEKETSFYDGLSLLSKAYIKSADIFYNSLLKDEGSDEMDWGGVINNYGRAFEQELLDKIFVPFREKVLSIEGSAEEINQLKKDTDLKMLVGFILEDKKLAIGNMEYILNTVIHSQKRKDLFLVKKFREFSNSLRDPRFISSKDGLCNSLKESIKYRNPSSHAGEIINRDFCEEAKSYILKMIKKLVATI